jgi:hypothetical protein
MGAIARPGRSAFRDESDAMLPCIDRPADGDVTIACEGLGRHHVAAAQEVIAAPAPGARRRLG